MMADRRKSRQAAGHEGGAQDLTAGDALRSAAVVDRRAQCCGEMSISRADSKKRFRAGSW